MTTLDADKAKRVTDESFELLLTAARKTAAREIARRRRLLVNLQNDLEKHGDPELWKRCGDLLLANASTAQRVGDRIIVTDYFEESAPVIEIEGEARRPLNEIAEGYFRRYVKARNGLRVIDERTAKTHREIAVWLEKAARIEAAVETGDAEFVASIIEPPRKAVEVRWKKKIEVEFKGARRFVSSDGFEILVGKRAADNDYLTFRVARSLDTWLHAADFPGSHVVIRNPNRKDVPQQTLLEAARIAAFYSDAREMPKAAVNYTLKKFVNKPKRAAPGLISLASFKTVLVEPNIDFLNS